MDSDNLVVAGLSGVAASGIQYLARWLGFSVSGVTAQLLAAALAVLAAFYVAATGTGIAVDNVGDLFQVVLVTAGTGQLFYNVIVSRLPQPTV